MKTKPDQQTIENLMTGADSLLGKSVTHLFVVFAITLGFFLNLCAAIVYDQIKNTAPHVYKTWAVVILLITFSLVVILVLLTHKYYFKPANIVIKELKKIKMEIEAWEKRSRSDHLFGRPARREKP